MKIPQTQSGLLNDITPVILTFNEAPNIGRTLAALTWASEVLVVDSGSDDGTMNLVQKFPNVRVMHRKFDSHAQQWNFAISETGIKTSWVLALDADYVLSPGLITELSELQPAREVDAYQTRFHYCVFGRPLRGTLYPPITTLFRTAKGKYIQDGHTQRLKLATAPIPLKQVIYHDDRKPLSRWLWAQERYASLEADLLASKPYSQLCLQDKLRTWMVITPWLVPLHCLIFGKGILDGWPGFFYALQRAVAESILSLKLLERRISEGNSQ